MPFSIPRGEATIRHRDPVLLMGSCFAEHMAGRMAGRKMSVLANPHGILYNPNSIAQALRDYLAPVPLNEKDLFLNHGVWGSWRFHSRLSHPDPAACLDQMNKAIEQGHRFLCEAKWLVVTFGSAYQYFREAGSGNREGVANCHKMPASGFEKKLCGTEAMFLDWATLVDSLRAINKELRIVFTVSPVRYVRDGLVENNRSKGRLLDLAHSLAESRPGCTYFPAYELLIDVLRDYRFYADDLVHPSGAAVQYIWDRFVSAYCDPADDEIVSKIEELSRAAAHRSLFPGSEADRKFRSVYHKKTVDLLTKYPYVDGTDFLERFSG